LLLQDATDGVDKPLWARPLPQQNIAYKEKFFGKTKIQ